MKYSVLITDTAKQDILNAVKYISENLNSPQAALKLYDTTYKQLESLSEFPKRNAEIEPLLIGLGGIRYILIENYIAFYTINDEIKTVNIVRFVYNKRDWQSILNIDTKK